VPLNSIVRPDDETQGRPARVSSSAPSLPPEGLLLTLFLWAIVVLVLLWSRLIDRPPYLYYFDNASFALSIEHFDPRLHQPQPPGYPLFVALLKTLHVFVQDPNRILIISGLLGSGVGLLLIWLWADRMFGRAAAWAATALLLLHPVFWTAGIGNPVRTFLVVIAGATAILGWAAMTRVEWRFWFYAMSIALGLLSGFRPETLVLLFPLWIATGMFRHAEARTWLTGSTLLLLSALAWLAPLVSHTGGMQSTVQTLFDYLRDNSRGYTAPFGASLSDSLATAGRALRWNFTLTIAWVWAVPLVWRSLHRSWSRTHSLLLMGAFLPAFLFHAFVHVRDVDQTLITIPVLCVLGGAVLAHLNSWSARFSGLVLALLISGWMFYRAPLFKDMVFVTHRAIRYHNKLTRSTMEALEEYRFNDDAIFIWDDVGVTWRQVSYYFPERRLLRLEGDPLWFTARQPGTLASVEEGVVLIPPVRWLVVGSYTQTDELSRLPGAQRRGPLVILPFGPGVEVKIAGRVLRGQY
jgi:hypothetical protein